MSLRLIRSIDEVEHDVWIELVVGFMCGSMKGEKLPPTYLSGAIHLQLQRKLAERWDHPVIALSARRYDYSCRIGTVVFINNSLFRFPGQCRYHADTPTCLYEGLGYALVVAQALEARSVGLLGTSMDLMEAETQGPMSNGHQQLAEAISHWGQGDDDDVLLRAVRQNEKFAGVRSEPFEVISLLAPEKGGPFSDYLRKRFCSSRTVETVFASDPHP